MPCPFKEQTFSFHLITFGLGCPLWKGNQAPHPKFDRPNGKKHKIQNLFDIGQELVRTAHLKAQ